MSLNSAMQIASSGLSEYQTAINVTSENISNVNTPGYNTQQQQCSNQRLSQHHQAACSTGAA